MATDRAGNVYAIDPRDRVQKFTSRGDFILQWGTRGNGKGEFDGVSGIAIDRAGNVYVVERRNDRVQKFTSRGKFLSAWGHAGGGPGRFDGPTAVAVDSAGSVYVVDTGNDRIEKFTSAGRFITQWGSSGSGPGQFKFPDGIATDQHGNVYVADTGLVIGMGVSKFTSDGRYLASWGSAGIGAESSPGNVPGFSATGIATDGVGRVYVSDLNWPVSRVYVFSYDGALLESFGGFGTADGLFKNPAGLATDSRGDLYVADSGNYRIQKFGNPSASFNLAGRVTTDPAKGTARLVATLPGVGELGVTGRGIERAGRTAKRAGDLGLPVTPSAATRRRLEENRPRRGHHPRHLPADHPGRLVDGHAVEAGRPHPAPEPPHGDPRRRPTAGARPLPCRFRTPLPRQRRGGGGPRPLRAARRPAGLPAGHPADHDRFDPPVPGRLEAHHLARPAPLQAPSRADGQAPRPQVAARPPADPFQGLRARSPPGRLSHVPRTGGRVGSSRSGRGPEAGLKHRHALASRDR